MLRDAETLAFELAGENYYAEIDTRREAEPAEERAALENEDAEEYIDEEIAAIQARLRALEIAEYGRPVTTIVAHTASICQARTCRGDGRARRLDPGEVQRSVLIPG
jgi:hypothetical protein